MVTNDPTLTKARALSIYQEQHHPEQRFKWLTVAGLLAPILLKKPHCIEAFFFIVGMVLQLSTLVEREAAQRIAASGKTLIGLKPNRLPSDRPTTEALLHVFRHITLTQVILAEHPTKIIMSPLNLLQTRVLQLLGLEESIARRYRMRHSRGVIGWIPLVLLTACVAPHPGEHQAGTVRPAVDRILTRGDIQVAQMHLREFGFDPGPIDGIYTAQTQAAVRAFQRTYGLLVSGLLDRQTREVLKVGAEPKAGD